MCPGTQGIQKRVLVSSGAGIACGCEAPDMDAREANTGPLWEQQERFTIEPPL